MSINLDLPGLYYDEASYPRVAIGIMEKQVKTNMYTIEVFDYKLPTYRQYTGGLLAYPYILNFSLFGTSIETIRMQGIIINSLTIVFTYLFANELFSKKIAISSSILLTFIPAFFFIGTKFAAWSSSIMFLFLIASLFFLVKWKKTDLTKYLFLSFLFIGFGISTKLNFVWFVFALVVLFLITKSWKNFSPKKILVSLIGLSLGSILFITYLVIASNNFLGFLLDSSSGTPYGASNSKIWENLLTRVDNLHDLLSGQALVMFGSNIENPVMVIIFTISILGLIPIAIIKRNSYRKKRFYLILIFGVMFLTSIFTASNFNPMQLIIFLPLVAIIISVFFDSVIRTKNKKLNHVLFSIPITVLILTNSFVLYQYNAELERTGGVGFFSEEISNLSEYLLENDYNNVIALDWGFTKGIYVHTQGEINGKEIFQYPNAKGITNYDKFVEKLEESFEDPTNVYLIRPEYGEQAFPVWDLLKETVELSDKELLLIKEFYQRDGKPVFQIYKIE